MSMLQVRWDPALVKEKEEEEEEVEEEVVEEEAEEGN